MSFSTKTSAKRYGAMSITVIAGPMKRMVASTGPTTPEGKQRSRCNAYATASRSRPSLLRLRIQKITKPSAVLLRTARVGGSVFSRHLRFDCRYSPDLVGQFAFRIPSIICALHSRPDPGAIAEQLTEPDGDGRGNRFPLVEDIVEMLARDTKQGGDLTPGLAGRGDHILAQQFAWVSRAPVPVALGCIFGHGIAPQ